MVIVGSNKYLTKKLIREKIGNEIFIGHFENLQHTLGFGNCVHIQSCVHTQDFAHAQQRPEKALNSKLSLNLRVGKKEVKIKVGLQTARQRIKNRCTDTNTHSISKD